MHDLKLSLDLDSLPEHMLLSSKELSKATDLLQQMHEGTLIEAQEGTRMHCCAISSKRY